MSAALGEVAEFINGFAFAPSDWQEDGLPIIRIQNLTDAAKPYNRTTRNVPPKYVVQPGNLLVSWSATLGVFTWNQPEPGLVNQHIFKVVPDGSRITPSYLRHMLAGALANMERHLHGATMKHVNRGEFLSTRIPLPPVEEQRRIAAILDQADALRAKRRQALDHLDTLTQSIFLDSFGGRPPAESRRLGELAHVTSGLTKGRKLNGQVTRIVPYLAVANVQAGRLDLRTVKEIEATAAEIDRIALKRGDLLLTEGGDPDKLGRGTLWREELPLALHQNHIFRVRLRDDSWVLPEYLSAFVASREARSYFLRSAKQTTGIASINTSQLRGLGVPIPSMASQQRFVEALRASEALTKTVAVQARTDAELFGSLQARAFAGSL